MIKAINFKQKQIKIKFELEKFFSYKKGIKSYKDKDVIR